MPDTARSYDDSPYQSLAYPQSHPDRLATVATLFGLTPPRLTESRVIEIGCAAGGNLLPMAATLPGSRFVGIDVSPAQIAVAREAVEALGLANVELHTGSFADFQAEAQSFDYVIAHGVYSWVAAPLRAELLALCQRLLAPHGVAYVSYNTYPGCGLRQSMRQLARLFARGAPSPGAQVAAARNLFTLVDRALEGRFDPHGRLVRAELEELRGVDDSYIAHEHLEDANGPCYFHEFAEAAAGVGLQYLGEAEIQTMSTATLPQPAVEMLRQTARDLIEAEQFLDFVHNRSFRQTLLCHAGLPIKRAIAPEVIEQLSIASSAKPATTPVDIRSAEPADFRGRDEINLRAADPLTKAALADLAAVWPLPLPFPDLAARAAERAGLRLDAEARRGLALRLLSSHATSPSIELHLLPPAFQSAIDQRPKALPLARWQARRGARVVNGRHENVILGETERALLQRLDGATAVGEIAPDFNDLLGTLARLASAALLEARSAAIPVDAESPGLLGKAPNERGNPASC